MRGRHNPASTDMLSIAVLAALLAITLGQGETVLYGMSANMQFEIVNTTTAKPAHLWPKLPYEYQGQGLSSIDSVHGIFYIIGTNISTDVIALVGISVINGSIIVEIPLPFLLEVFIGVGQYCDVDPTNGDVYVTGRDPQSLSHVVYRVNPFTQEIHLVAKVGDGQGLLEILGGTSVLDPLNRVLWIQIARNDSGTILLRFYGYDIDTGFNLFVIEDQLNMGTFDFYPTTGLIYGLGTVVKGESFEFVLVSFNSATTLFTQLALLPGFDTYLGAVSAIDDEKGLLWVYMQTTPKSGPTAQNRGLRANAPPSTDMSMNLIAIDIAAGKIVQSVLACHDFSDCPWNIQCLS